MKNQKAPNPKYPGDPGHSEKTKPKDNRNRRGRRISPKRHSKYLQQNCRRKLSLPLRMR